MRNCLTILFILLSNSRRFNLPIIIYFKIKILVIHISHCIIFLEILCKKKLIQLQLINCAVTIIIRLWRIPSKYILLITNLIRLLLNFFFRFLKFLSLRSVDVLYLLLNILNVNSFLPHFIFFFLIVKVNHSNDFTFDTLLIVRFTISSWNVLVISIISVLTFYIRSIFNM